MTKIFFNKAVMKEHQDMETRIVCFVNSDFNPLFEK